MNIKNQLENKLSEIVSGLADEKLKVEVSVSSDLAKGDLTTNAALVVFSKAKNIESRIKNYESPMELGEAIVEDLRKDVIYKKFKKIELARPGFINFFFSDEEIDVELDRLMQSDSTKKTGKKILFEFGDPNPFKEPHIGHLRNFTTGEALVRLLESQGDEVFRLSYQGDVGLHVAKTIWGLKNLGEKTIESGDLDSQVKALGKAYQEGARFYEDDKNAKDEIDDLNVKIYSATAEASADMRHDSEVYILWQKGREISLDHFEELYKTLGIKYDKYYFEKEVADKGKEIVEKNTPQVFVEDDGAVIYKGEDDNLHNRVFLNSRGAPTYEAKDLALAVAKDNDFPDTDKSMIMTAGEQVDYFRVVLKALEKIESEIAQKTTHLSYGFVNLRDGKMSSRKGQVVAANWLIEEVQKSIKNDFKEVSDEVLSDIALGAIKWSMLKFSRESDISFSVQESIDLTGNSGPYMQYAIARISSIIDKSSKSDSEANSVKNLPPELLALGRELCQYESHKKQATESMQPNVLTEYLFALAKSLNSFYEKEKIVGHKSENEIISVLMVARSVLVNGLYLLGISAPKKI